MTQRAPHGPKSQYMSSTPKAPVHTWTRTTLADLSIRKVPPLQGRYDRPLRLGHDVGSGNSSTQASHTHFPNNMSTLLCPPHLLMTIMYRVPSAFHVTQYLFIYEG